MSLSLTLCSVSKLNVFKKYFLIILILTLAFNLSSNTALGQTPDAMFHQARQMAFEQKDFNSAIQLCRRALKQSPDYLDIQLFLGRLYYWNNQPDSSLHLLNKALLTKPDYEDAAQALADILYFKKDYDQSLKTVNQGLQYHPTSANLATLKAKNLGALFRSQEAFLLADSLLQANPGQDQLRALASQLREFSFKNKIGVSYDFTHFNKQFTHPWHLTNLDYSRLTKLGTITGRVSYTNRYNQGGWQLEADAYPRLSKTFYAYTSVGFSPDMPVFPKLRAGLSLYANLPQSWEAEAGIRYLNFNNVIFVYTFSVGKYYHNFWFNLRTYLSIGDDINSQSINFTTRYYLKGADDYFSLIVGRGISPDDRTQAIRLNSTYRLQTTRIGAGYRFALVKRHLLSFSGTFESGEYMPEKNGNQFSLSAGYQYRF